MNKKIDRILNMAQIVAFIVTVATSLPLLVSYLRGVEPIFPLFVHLHVWLGLIFIIVAIIRMGVNRRMDLKRGMPHRQE